MNSRITFNEYWCGQFRRLFGSSHAVFVNPIRRVGIAYFVFQTLFELGLNKWHSTSAIIARLKELMSSVGHRDGGTCWESYCNRISRKNGNVSANILKTLNLLQTVYGARLAEMNCCVDILKMDSETLFRLNTCSPKPLRQRVRVNGKQTKQRTSFWSRFFTVIVTVLIVLRHTFNGTRS